MAVSNSDKELFDKLNRIDISSFIGKPTTVFLDSLNCKYKRVIPAIKKPKVVDRLVFYYGDSISVTIKVKDFVEKDIFRNMEQFDLPRYLNSNISVLRFFYAGNCFKGCEGYDEKGEFIR